MPIEVWKISKGAGNCGFFADVSHFAMHTFEASGKFACIVKVDVSHF